MGAVDVGADLNDLHIETVEDLASVSDGNMTRMINGRTLREQAIDYAKRQKACREPAERAMTINETPAQMLDKDEALRILREAAGRAM